jgi:xanthine dehydrogenase accessory factor
MANARTYFEQGMELGASGVPFVTVTFLASRGSAPQDAGSKMIVTGEGLCWGTIGGGRIEARAIEDARAMLEEAVRAPRPNARPTRLLEWDLGRDLGMTCGGAVTLFFEAFHTNVWNIAIFGAGHVSQALVPILLTLGCRVTVVDARAQWLDRLPRSANVSPVLTDDPPAHVAQLPDGAFVLSLTPGHQFDLDVMRAVFRSGRAFPYVGVIGSKRKAAELRKGLVEEGFGEDAVGRIHCPVGLPIGTNAPPEIAVSIAAELLQERDRLAR